MKVTHRAVMTTLSAAVLGMLLVPAASACALSDQPVALANPQPMQDPQDLQQTAASANLPLELRNLANGKSPTIVGMWSFQFISMGNMSHNPSIADGAELLWGYNQFHSDKTEILNAGTRSPAQQNFCLGVWQKTGEFTYQVNHYALNYNPTTGALIGKIIVIEMVTVSPGGTAFSGTFVETIFDPTGKQTDQLSGQVRGQRMTVDTTTP